jgi:hypothetical protein
MQLPDSCLDRLSECLRVVQGPARRDSCENGTPPQEPRIIIVHSVRRVDPPLDDLQDLLECHSRIGHGSLTGNRGQGTRGRSVPYRVLFRDVSQYVWVHETVARNRCPRPTPFSRRSSHENRMDYHSVCHSQTARSASLKADFGRDRDRRTYCPQAEFCIRHSDDHFPLA